MIRVLFVDDESSILDGLRNLLRGMRREWEMVFALGGPAGLAEIEKKEFDVVVSDMRMPGMDGQAFLTKVKECHPRTIRMVLSGQTDGDTAMKTVFVAHQFLAKPCDPESLKEVIGRACNLNALVTNETLKTAAGDIGMLPTAPGVYLKLTQIVANPNSSIKDISAVFEKDIGLVSKLLQIVNSAFFGLPRKVSQIEEAASLLGTLTLKNLTLSIESFSNCVTLDAAELKSLQEHSLLCGNIARRALLPDRKKAEAAFVAGMLHDIGYLVGTDLRRRGKQDAGGAHHAHLGAYLLAIWGLPFPIIEAVANHESPWEIQHTGFDILDAVYLANCIASDLAPTDDKTNATVKGIDFGYLESRGIKMDTMVALQTEARGLLASMAKSE